VAFNANIIPIAKVGGFSGTGTPPLPSLVAAAATGVGVGYAIGPAVGAWTVQITTTGSPTFSVALEGSLDGVNFVAVGAAMTAAGLYTFQIPLPYVQLRLTAISGGGTVSGTIVGADTGAGTGVGPSPPVPPGTLPGAASNTYRNISLLNTGVNIKAAPGVVTGWYLANNAAAARFVKLYNETTVPVAADTPLLTIELPAGSAANVSFANPINFSAGIGIRGTQLVADNDNTAPSANDIVVGALLWI
jgi:hypothetical protein